MTRKTHISLLTLATAASFALGYVAPAARAAEAIQPGSSITMGGSYCTLNWIYDGTGARDGDVFGGTAAHCVSGVGQVVYNASGSLGTQGTRIGEVAYVSSTLDSALILIDTTRHGDVIAALKGHPNIPTGVSLNSQVGDLIQFSGNGIGFHLTQQTRESRVGVLAYDDGTQHYVDGPVSNGDSGGPVANITDGNTALGIVNTLGVAASSSFGAAVGEGGVSLPALFSDAAGNGFPIELRTI
jgi:hypothetical protein